MKSIDILHLAGAKVKAMVHNKLFDRFFKYVILNRLVMFIDDIQSASQKKILDLKCSNLVAHKKAFDVVFFDL